MKLGQGAIPCLVLGGVVGPQIVEGEAPADHLGLQGVDHGPLPARGESRFREWAAVLIDEDMQRCLRAWQLQQPLGQVQHGRTHGDVLRPLRAAVLLGAHQPDLAGLHVDLRHLQGQELHADLLARVGGAAAVNEPEGTMAVV